MKKVSERKYFFDDVKRRKKEKINVDDTRKYYTY